MRRSTVKVGPRNLRSRMAYAKLSWYLGSWISRGTILVQSLPDRPFVTKTPRQSVKSSSILSCAKPLWQEKEQPAPAVAAVDAGEPALIEPDASAAIRLNRPRWTHP